MSKPNTESATRARRRPPKDTTIPGLGREGDAAAVWMATRKVRAWAGNPRSVSEEQIQQVVRSMRAYGFGAPIVARRNGEIIAGHTRLAAAERLGLTLVPVRMMPWLTDAQAEELTVADNRLGELGQWNTSKLADLLAKFDGDARSRLGFTKADTKRLLEKARAPSPTLATGGAPDQSAQAQTSFVVLIDCSSEQHQLDVIAKCQQEGWKCRALI